MICCRIIDIYAIRYACCCHVYIATFDACCYVTLRDALRRDFDAMLLLIFCHIAARFASARCHFDYADDADILRVVAARMVTALALLRALFAVAMLDADATRQALARYGAA